MFLHLDSMQYDFLRELVYWYTHSWHSINDHFKIQPVFNLWGRDRVSSLLIPFATLAIYHLCAHHKSLLFSTIYNRFWKKNKNQKQQNSILPWANVNNRQICGVSAHLVRHKHNQRPAAWENKTGSATFLKTHSCNDNANEIAYVKLSHETVSPQWIGVIHLQEKKTRQLSLFYT